MDIEIPANTTATVYVPAANAEMIKENGTAISSSKDIQVTGHGKWLCGAENWFRKISFRNFKMINSIAYQIR